MTRAQQKSLSTQDNELLLSLMRLMGEQRVDKHAPIITAEESKSEELKEVANS
jgi:hypothetical protein